MSHATSYKNFGEKLVLQKKWMMDLFAITLNASFPVCYVISIVFTYLILFSILMWDKFTIYHHISCLKPILMQQIKNCIIYHFGFWVNTGGCYGILLRFFVLPENILVSHFDEVLCLNTQQVCSIQLRGADFMRTADKNGQWSYGFKNNIL